MFNRIPIDMKPVCEAVDIHKYHITVFVAFLKITTTKK